MEGLRKLDRRLRKRTRRVFFFFSLFDFLPPARPRPLSPFPFPDLAPLYRLLVSPPLLWANLVLIVVSGILLSVVRFFFSRLSSFVPRRTFFRIPPHRVVLASLSIAMLAIGRHLSREFRIHVCLFWIKLPPRRVFRNQRPSAVKRKKDVNRASAFREVLPRGSETRDRRRNPSRVNQQLSPTPVDDTFIALAEYSN